MNNIINSNKQKNNFKDNSKINFSNINKDNCDNVNINKNKAIRMQSYTSSKKSEGTFEKEFLFNIDNEKTHKIAEMIDEDAGKIISIIIDDMNILQRASFLNKISSVKTIIKELKKKFNKENNNLSKLNDFINYKNKRGYTSLHYSIICGNLEIYKFLIKNGADRNILTNSGYNNLILACQTKRTYVFLDEIKNIIINKHLDLTLLFSITDKSNATL